MPWVIADWSGSKDLIIKTRIKPDARVIDITDGAGAELFKRFEEDYLSKHPDLNPRILYESACDAFANFFGADVLKYHYSEMDPQGRLTDKQRVEAFVIKNLSAFEAPEPLARPLIPMTQLKILAADLKTRSELEAFAQTLYDQGLKGDEATEIFRSVAQSAPPGVSEVALEIADKKPRLPSSHRIYNKLFLLSISLD